MQLVLDHQLRRTRTVADTEECAGPFIPSETCKLVDGSDQQRRRASIEGFVHDVAGQRAGIDAEGTLPVCAPETEVISGCVVTQLDVERGAAPWTTLQEQLVARFRFSILDLAHQFSSLNERVGADLAADPDSDVDGSLAEPRCIFPSHQFQRAHHARRTFELLAGKQSQRVTHESASPSSRSRMPQAAPNGEKRDEAKVGFGLAATSGKPDEVQHVAKRVLFPDHGLHGRQQECQLKRTPMVGAGVLAGHPVCLAHLIEHGAVRQPERLFGERVRAQHLDARAHPFEGNAHPVADTVGGSPFPPVRERRRDATLLGNPVGVSIDEALELIRYRRRGEPGEGEDTLFCARFDGDQRHFSLGHEVGPDPRCLATFQLPVYRSAVTNGVDSLLPVLKLELLLLLGEQTRIDSWIVDKLAALEHALQPCLEQRFLHPVACSVSTRSGGVEFSPVRQGDGQDEATSMRPGASVYAGAPFPDPIAGLVARSTGPRPGHGALRKLGPLVQR